MSLIYALIGAVAGGMLHRFPGVIFGACAGWLLGNLAELQERFSSLEKEVAWLRQRVARQAKEADTHQTQAVAPNPLDMIAKPAEETPAPPSPVTPARPASASGFRVETSAPPLRPQPIREAPANPEASPIVDAITNFFTGGNLLVKSGIIILFFGVSFLVKYAAEHGHVPIQLRLAATAFGGIVLLATGWRLRQKRAEYALALQGGGIGILFLTTYATFRLFALLSPTSSFILLVAISGLCGALAVLQSSRTLALFGISGGFIAPLLASIGNGNPAFLFGYYAVLNAGIVGIAWYRSWRALNLAGFLYTFLIGAIWGAQFYRPAHFATVEPFLILFFLIYVSIAVLFAFRQPPELQGIVDGTLVFGTPIAAFALQAGLVHTFRYGLAWSALAAGFLYLAMFMALREDDRLHTLADAFLAFGIVFVTLAVPLAFDGRWTSAAWAVEGAALIWAGLRQRRQLARGLGILLQFGGGIAFITDLPFPINQLPVLNSLYLGCTLISLAALSSAWLIHHYKTRAEEWELTLGHVLSYWGLIWWFGSGLHEHHVHVAEDLVYGVSLIFVTASCLTSHILQRRLGWSDLSWPPLLLLPAMVCFLLPEMPHHPLAQGGWFAWPAAFTVHWWLLYQREDEVPTLYRSLLHGGTVWFMTFLATWELGWQVHFFLGTTGSWLTISRGIVAITMLFAILSVNLPVWPWRKHEELYLGIVAFPLAAAVLFWTVLVSLGSTGDAWPFPWLPLFNPLDLTIAGALAALGLWIARLQKLPGLCEFVSVNRQVVQWLGAAVFFVWLNSMLARALHHWGGVTFTPEAIFRSGLAQTSFAIFWSLLALCAMVLATCRALRKVWLAGAGLLGCVIIKLFLVDLAGHGTIERIVSFVAVGLLLLVIGWFSPVPPKK